MWGRKFIVVIIISFFHFLALIPIVFDLPRYFLTELFVFLALLIISVIAAAAVYAEQRWSWTLFAVAFAAALVNLMAVYFLSTRLFLFAIAIVLGVIGFLYSLFNIEGAEEYEYDKYEEKLDKDVSDEEVIVEEIKPLKEPEKPLKASEKKYIGSMKRSEYHSPQCIAAKRISKKNAVWFSSDKDAEQQGYSAHSCVK